LECILGVECSADRFEVIIVEQTVVAEEAVRLDLVFDLVPVECLAFEFSLQLAPDLLDGAEFGQQLLGQQRDHLLDQLVLLLAALQHHALQAGRVHVLEDGLDFGLEVGPPGSQVVKVHVELERDA